MPQVKIVNGVKFVYGDDGKLLAVEAIDKQEIKPENKYEVGDVILYVGEHPFSESGIQWVGSIFKVNEILPDGMLLAKLMQHNPFYDVNGFFGVQIGHPMQINEKAFIPFPNYDIAGGE